MKSLPALRNTCGSIRILVNLEQRREKETNTNLAERVRLDLGELVLHVVGVHGADLVTGGGAEHLDDFDKLINAGLAREEWLSQHELSHDAASAPDV